MVSGFTRWADWCHCLESLCWGGTWGLCTWSWLAAACGMSRLSMDVSAGSWCSWKTLLGIGCTQSRRSKPCWSLARSPPSSRVWERAQSRVILLWVREKLLEWRICVCAASQCGGQGCHRGCFGDCTAGTSLKLQQDFTRVWFCLVLLFLTHVLAHTSDTGRTR